jgi:hypothetical protein
LYERRAAAVLSHHVDAMIATDRARAAVVRERVLWPHSLLCSMWPCRRSFHINININTNTSINRATLIILTVVKARLE